MTPGVHL